MSLVKETPENTEVLEENIAAPVELTEMLLNVVPNFFTLKQKSQYKECVARILFEKLNEESNYGRYNPKKSDKDYVKNYIISIFLVFLKIIFHSTPPPPILSLLKIIIS